MDIVSKITAFVKHYQRDLFLYGCILLVGAIGYNIGRLSDTARPSPEAKDAAIYQGDTSYLSVGTVSAKTSAVSPKNTDPRVVASKNSKSKLYHYTWCPGASKIKDANKVWFDTAAAADAAGYTLAANCNL